MEQAAASQPASFCVFHTGAQCIILGLLVCLESSAGRKREKGGGDKGGGARRQRAGKEEEKNGAWGSEVGNIG